MWSQGGFTDQSNPQLGAGGFMSAEYGNSPSAPEGKKTPKRSQNFFPVNIRQIMRAGEEDLKIGDLEAQMVTIVGLVKSVNITSTKITYLVCDDTGIIEATQWIETDNDGGEAPKINLVENTYCRIIGTVRNFQGKKLLMLFKAIPIKDLNEITTHILEVIYAKKKAIQYQDKQALKTGVSKSTLPNSMIANEMEATPVAVYGVNRGALTPLQKSIFTLVQNCTAAEGIDAKDIYNALKEKSTKKEIDNILEFLSSEGHVYSTIDDTHYMTTSS